MFYVYMIWIFYVRFAYPWHGHGTLESYPDSHWLNVLPLLQPIELPKNISFYEIQIIRAVKPSFKQSRVKKHIKCKKVVPAKKKHSMVKHFIVKSMKIFLVEMERKNFKIPLNTKVRWIL